MFRTPERDVHVHLWVAGSDDVTRHLEFRDRLRASEADRRAYSGLKHGLASASGTTSTTTPRPRAR